MFMIILGNEKCSCSWDYATDLDGNYLKERNKEVYCDHERAWKVGI